MIVVKKEKAKSILRYKHPWIFKNSIRYISGDYDNGDIVRVETEEGTPIGYGFYSPHSLIAVRIVDFEKDRLEADWIDRKIEKSVSVRKKLHIDSNAFRLVNSEGDFFPGIIVDIYNNTAVVKVQIRGIEKVLDEIISSIRKYLPVENIYLKRDEKAARMENLQLPGGYIFGNGDGTEQITENGLLFKVDFARGQKTGFYLDQRENRLVMKSIAEKLSVLNLFSYTGAFAIYASAGNAVHVCSVESSSSAVSISRENEELNRGKLKGSLEWENGDVLEFLSKSKPFDIIVLDPPPFAKKRHEVSAALKAYSRLNELALVKLKQSGFLLTFTCSGGVTRQMFRDMLFRTALKVKRNVRLVSELHAAKDHPFSLFHPEGEYLKGWLLYAE